MNKPESGFGIGRRCDWWRCWSVIVSVLASFCQCHGQGIHTPITFDGPPVFRSGDVYREYQESGISFTAITNQQGYGGFVRIQGRWSDHPYNGTAYIASPLYGIEVTSISGLLFGLESVDLAEHSQTSPNAVTVLFIGYLTDGSIVTTSFTTDGIIGVPGTSDFQTFYFGPAFSSGLTRVEIPGVGAALDNLVVIIPEPSTYTLFWLGLLVVGAWRLKRKGITSIDASSSRAGPGREDRRRLTGT